MLAGSRRRLTLLSARLKERRPSERVAQLSPPPFNLATQSQSGCCQTLRQLSLIAKQKSQNHQDCCIFLPIISRALSFLANKKHIKLTFIAFGRTRPEPGTFFLKGRF